VVDPRDLPLVLVLLGRVGAGKSSTANTLLALPEGSRFDARRSAAAVTGVCQAASTTVGGREVLVLDTPGLGDSDGTLKEVYTEIRRGITELTPAGALLCPLLILSLQGRVTEDDFAMVEALKEHVFGHLMLASTVVAWTHADSLEGGDIMEGYLQNAGERLRSLLAEVKGGYVPVDNRQPPPVDGSAAPQVEAVVRQAEVVGVKCTLCRIRERGYGRKSARRQRQIEAGLIQPKAMPQESGGNCVVA